MYEFPIVKLELQGMKQSIAIAFAQYQNEISESVSAQLEEVINNFDYAQAVKDCARQILKQSIEESVKSFFFYGGGREAIRDVIKEAFKKLFDEDESEAKDETV